MLGKTPKVVMLPLALVALWAPLSLVWVAPMDGPMVPLLGTSFLALVAALNLCILATAKAVAAKSKLSHVMLPLVVLAAWVFLSFIWIAPSEGPLLALLGVSFLGLVVAWNLSLWQYLYRETPEGVRTADGPAGKGRCTGDRPTANGSPRGVAAKGRLPRSSDPEEEDDGFVSCEEHHEEARAAGGLGAEPALAEEPRRSPSQARGGGAAPVAGELIGAASEALDGAPPHASQVPEDELRLLGSAGQRGPARDPVPSGPEAGLLAPTIQLFRAAAVLDPGGEAREVRREPFVQGLEACAEVLNKLGGGMGNYLLTNTRKLRNSKAPVSEDSYGPWLLSEYPVHAATGYRGYVDDSAWMANLWIGWTMEFFVEFFALLSDGQETQQSVDAAYQQTLRAHHGLVQRAAFSAAVRQLPPRQDLLERLRGGAKKVAVERELGDFADIVRPLARFCIRTNEALQQRLQAEHAALTGRRAA
mmetsp:Transcript_136031/g.379134  ORF Transcript_136031/g.379134 Transcript_136031/m.379134 type:complete len:475 (+) Transcript_136031:186-1610(+)